MMKLRMTAFAVAASAAASLFAETATTNGVTWTFTVVDGQAEIYKGDSVAAISTATVGALNIPSVLDGYPVTRIGAWSFYRCAGLTGVTIPDSVTSIGKGAFQYCTGLTDVTIPDSVASIGDCAFAGCTKLAAVVVPDGIEGIAYGAFMNSGLKDIVIPGGVTNIGDNAFELCKSLESVVIPEGVTSIGALAFYECTGLQSVAIPDSVTTIGDYAFYKCTGLRSLYIPDGVTSIGKGAFKGMLYTVDIHRNDGSDGEREICMFGYEEQSSLPSIAKLGWERRGYEFVGWATNAMDAARGVVWAEDKATLSTEVGPCETLELYGVWKMLPGFYAITFIRNDGAGTWRTVGFPYGTKTRMPTLAGELGWARRGYEFKGWELTTTNANDNTRAAPWKGDWAYVSKPVAAGKTLLVYARWQLKEGYYQMRFNKNDGTGKWRSLGFECGKISKISTIAALGWEREGCTFLGWASNKANAEAGKVWKTDGAWVTDATAEGKTLSIYALWE